MASESTVLQLRLDDDLKTVFADAAQRERTTPSKAMKALMKEFVQESWRKEAQRQSRVVVAASDADATMDEITHVQGWILDA